MVQLHEVIAAEPGNSITLRGLAGTDNALQEKSASRTVRARDVLLARVVDLGDRAILGVGGVVRLRVARAAGA